MAVDDFPADSDVVHAGLFVGGGQVLAIRVERAEAFVVHGLLDGVCEPIASLGEVKAAPLVHAPDLAPGHLEGAHVELLVIEAVAVEWPLGVVPGLRVLIFRLWLIAEVRALDLRAPVLPVVIGDNGVALLLLFFLSGFDPLVDLHGSADLDGVLLLEAEGGVDDRDAGGDHAAAVGELVKLLFLGLVDADGSDFFFAESVDLVHLDLLPLVHPDHWEGERNHNDAGKELSEDA